RPVLWSSIIALTLLSVLWPPPLAPAADLLRLPQNVPVDWFFGFWLPVTQHLPGWSIWPLGAALLGGCATVPWLTRAPAEELPAPATVNERQCTGCEQCVHDCPYDAIAMVARSDDRHGMVARVNTDLCTSCGICV